MLTEFTVWRRALVAAVAVLLLLVSAISANYFRAGSRIDYSFRQYLAAIGMHEYIIASTYAIERPVLFGDMGGEWLVTTADGGTHVFNLDMITVASLDDRRAFVKALSKRQISDLGGSVSQFVYYRDERRLGPGTICRDVSCSLDVFSDGRVALVRMLGF